MLEPPQRQKPATEIETKISAGDVDAIAFCVTEFDAPLHKHLSSLRWNFLTHHDREDIIALFFAKMIDNPGKYRASESSFLHFAKTCVENMAKDLKRKRRNRKERNLDPSVVQTLRLRSDDPETQCDNAAAMERAKKIVGSFDVIYRDALEALWRYGSTGYKQAMVNEFGISGDVAAKRLSRARSMLEEALGPSICLEP